MNLLKFFNLCLVATCLLLCLQECHSQLTFTPNWGKRSQQSSTSQNVFTDSTNNGANSNNNIPQPMNCNPKIDSVLLIYRLIQNEAQKMLDCSQQQKK